PPAQLRRDDFAGGYRLWQSLLGQRAASRREHTVAQRDGQRSQRDDLRVERVNQQSHPAPHPFSRFGPDLPRLRIIAQHRLDYFTNRRLARPPSRKHSRGQLDYSLAGSEALPRTRLAESNWAF